MKKNAYLKTGRLADVIAAITALSTYKFYKLNFEGWSRRINGTPERAAHWKSVITEHPEFFRTNTKEDMASLVWRRQFSKTYHVDQRVDIPVPEGNKKHDEYLERLSRRPLEPSEITALISIATNLHDRALEQEKARRWWIPLATGILAMIGAMAGGLLSNSDVAARYFALESTQSGEAGGTIGGAAPDE